MATGELCRWQSRRAKSRRIFAAKLILTRGEQFPGRLRVRGERSYEDELRGARARLRTSIARWSLSGPRVGAFALVSVHPRPAAARGGHLGLNKEWYYQVRETAECPGCGERVKPTVAVCKSCGAVLDREKAVALDCFGHRRNCLPRWHSISLSQACRSQVMSLDSSGLHGPLQAFSVKAELAPVR